MIYLDLLMLGSVGAGVICVGLLTYWCIEDFGSRDD